MSDFDDDVYEEEVVEEQLEDDEMAPEEAAFMQGYDKDADDSEKSKEDEED